MREIIADIENMNPAMRDFAESIVTTETPVETTPVVEAVADPVVAPIVTQTPATPVENITPPAGGGTPPSTPEVIVPDLQKIKLDTLKGIFGDEVDSEEKARELLDSYKKPAEVADPFANDYIKGLNQYLKDGGSRDVYDKVMTLKVDGLTAFDAQKTLMLWENPELNEEDVALALQDKYRQTDEDSDTDKRIGAVHLATDGKAAIKKLTELQNLHAIPEPVRIARNNEAIESERMSKWAPVAPTIVDGIKELEVSLGENQTFKFTGITPQVRAEALADVQRAITHSGIQHTAESVSQIQSIAKERILVRELPNILRAIKDQTATDVEARIRAEYSNPSPVVTGDTPPGTADSPQDAMFKLQMARLSGGVPRS